MLFDLLTFGGVLFWIAVGFIFLIITTQVHNQRLGWATTTLVLAIAATVLLTSAGKQVSTITFKDVAYFIGAYLLGALIWSTIKWRMFFLPALFERYEDARANWLKSQGLKEMPADPAARNQFLNSSPAQYININHTRMASHNKSRITGWMIFWPFSLVETFIGDFLVRIFDRMYKMVRNVYQRMSDSMASKYDELA